MGWEYLIAGLRSKRQDHLNELGAQGWELLFFEGNEAVLKRRRSVNGDIAIREPHRAKSTCQPASTRERV